MIKVEHIDTYGFEAAIRGMRNPMNSWDKGDSRYCTVHVCDGEEPDKEYIWCELGKNDLALMQKLYKAGPEHAKYLRMIGATMDITSNHIFWAEWDTYKVGVTKNSCSKMHKIHVNEFTEEGFSCEGIKECGGIAYATFMNTLYTLEQLRKAFNETHATRYWRAMIELLPMGYNLKATVSLNYATVMNIINQRSTHKLMEWRELCETLRGLPYIEAIRNEH